MRYERESQADRLRRRLQERRERIEKATRPRISPFTFISIGIILLLIFLFFFTGCAARPAQNRLEPRGFARAEHELLQLIMPFGNFFVHDFNVDEGITNVEIWMDIYAYGEVVESFAPLNWGYPNPENPLWPPISAGQIVLVESSNLERDAVEWLFHLVCADNGPRTISNFEIPIFQRFGPNVFHARAESMDIVAGEIIILETYKNAHGADWGGVNIRHIEDLQALATQPELMAEFPFARVIKLRFS
ncbi:MAG: hypothetical protein LBE35_03145 [Clostridiales bacterium]|jgi:hypothetical protein|nr:hypothetical protein [Clostridiales bacterium]